MVAGGVIFVQVIGDAQCDLYQGSKVTRWLVYLHDLTDSHADFLDRVTHCHSANAGPSL